MKLFHVAFEALDLLGIVGRPERAGDERLRFAAREHARSVRPRQHAGLDQIGRISSNLRPSRRTLLRTRRGAPFLSS
jgi:hypothetical protein